MLKVLTLHFGFFVTLCKLQGEWHAQQCIKNQDAIHIASIKNFSTRKQNAIPAMSQPAQHAVSWSVRGFAGPPQVSQPTAADPGPNRLHTGKRWHPNPQNPHEVQLRKKIDMKWEREKRRRKKRREEAAAAATAKPAENAATAEAAEPAAKAGTAGTAATAETAEACASSSKPEPVPLAIQEQKPKMMAKKEKKSRKEKKHKKEKVRPLIQVKEEQEDDDVKPGVSEALWKQGEEWADELTKEWLAQPACDEEEEKFKDFCRRKDLQQVMPDDQSDPALILVSIGKKSLLGHRCCVQISHAFF